MIFFALNGITILNNTHEVKSCTLTDSNGVLAKSFQIMPNKMYLQRTRYDIDWDKDIDVDILDTRPVIYHLQCGDKALDLGLFFVRGRG